MAKLLLIDGYNLMHQLDRAGRASLQQSRERLLDALEDYKRSMPGLKLLCVFDAWKSGDVTPTREFHGGIEIRYSARTQRADDLIIELASEYGAGAVVVSSDRRVQSGARMAGAETISSLDLVTQMVRPRPQRKEESGADFDRESDRVSRPGPKRGNPRRLSKTERKRRRLLDKL